MSESRWKEPLLKSSLPLEHLVAKKLADLKWLVWGQFSYSRKNEAGQSVDFSADLHATKEYSSKTHWLGALDVLIECKYASPGIRWVFLPYPETSQLFSGLVKVLDRVANKRLTNRQPFEFFERDLEYCVRGISLHDGGFDETAIHRGSSQLRYAMPWLVETVFSGQAHDWHDSDIPIRCALSILVTTAPIYRLKPELTLEQVHAAKSPDEVMDAQDAVILWEGDSPDRRRYADEIFDDHSSEDVGNRIAEYAKVFVSSKKVPYPPSQSNAKKTMADAGDHILVTTVDRLPTVLKALDAAAKKSFKGIEKIAEVHFDRHELKAAITKLNDKPDARA